MCFCCLFYTQFLPCAICFQIVVKYMYVILTLLVLIALICCLTELLFYSVCIYLSSSPAICLLECRMDCEGFLASSMLMKVSLEVLLEEKKAKS